MNKKFDKVVNATIKVIGCFAEKKANESCLGFMHEPKVPKKLKNKHL